MIRSPKPPRRMATRFLMATGGAVIASGFLTSRLLPLEAVWIVLKWPLVTLGCLVILGAGLVGRQVSTSTALGCGVAIWTFLATATVGEVGCRWAQLDLRGEEAAQSRMPPFFREPRRPSGTVFYRRHGPEAWTGQPIRTRLAIEGLAAAETYRDEPVITVEYDALGFRQGEPGDDWEVAVAGDSFVELGCLAHADLHTTLVGKRTGWRVRNLGASNTGPLTHLHYLEEFGRAPGLRQAVVVFYEGNDLQDLAWERKAVDFHARTGKRGYRTLHRQTSPIGALHEALHRPPTRAGPAELSTPVHHFASRDGIVPVTLPPFAPDPTMLDATVVEAWEGFLNRYAAFGTRQDIPVWIAYMPCKARVLHGFVQPEEPNQTHPTHWNPTPLPAWIADRCRRHGIRFLDLTPALRRAVETDHLCPFNGMVDTHLNALGSRLVAGELATALVHSGGSAAGDGDR